jgi:hypothetical protein
LRRTLSDRSRFLKASVTVAEQRHTTGQKELSQR